MNDPAHSPASSPTSLDAVRERAKPSERARFFTPGHSDPARRPHGLRYLAPLAAVAGEDIEQPVNAPHRRQAHDDSKPLESLRPALVPNAAVPFLQEVDASSHPERIDRHVSTAARLLAVAALGTAVTLAIASSFAFRVRPATPVTTVEAPGTVQTSARPPALTASATGESVREALAMLNEFMIASTAAARQSAVGSGESLPAPLAHNGPIVPLVEAKVDHRNARLLCAGTFKVVLVPVIETTGLPRSAAVVHAGDRWRVDWRSVFTPEPIDWNELVAGSSRGAGLFRVRLARAADGGWSVGRRSADHHGWATTIAPGSRVAAELSQALADNGGAPLVADVFLESDPDRRLNIVDWAKDKWSL